MKELENKCHLFFLKTTEKNSAFLVQSKMHIASGMKIYFVSLFCGSFSSTEMDPNIYICYFINNYFAIYIKLILHRCWGITFGCE